MDTIIPRIQKHLLDGSNAQAVSLAELRIRGEKMEAGWIWGFSDWMNTHYEIPFYVMICYVLFVYFGRKFMEKRAPFELKYPLAIWNALLAGFSIYGAYILIPIFFSEWIWGKGFLWEMCHGDAEISNAWTLYFCLSKIPELLDTAFIVLRKRPLRFLQYYHHIVTMWFCWAAWANKLECGGTYAVMNLVIHSFMYTYYMCSALHIRWPDWARQMITFGQLSQMVFGIIFVIIPLINCPSAVPLLFSGLAMYITYFILFAHLFYEMYILPKQTSTKKEEHIKKD
jgi:hypothetical protein